MRPYFTSLHGALFEGDCLDFLANVKPNQFDCIFADPPFNIGKDYRNGYNDEREQDAYFEWSRRWIGECIRTLKPGGSFFIYATPELAVRFAGFMHDHLTFRHWIALTMKGTYPRGRRLYPAHYALLYYSKGEPAVFNKLRIPVATCRHCGKEIKDYGGHRDKLHPDGLNLTDFWDDTSPNRHKKFKIRPGVNELKLVIPERAIQISTNPGDLVFDPFGGGGSTFQAAELSHRRWVGTELFDSHYIKQRFEIQLPVFASQVCAFDYNAILYENHFDTVLRRSEGEGLPVGAV
ncbi:MAG: DNA methyltransferase [Bacteroidia bacterium]|nr:DNA methyltransferase [Bacteroidia bacterium]